MIWEQDHYKHIQAVSLVHVRYFHNHLNLDSVLSGGSLGRRTRCSDKFVRYPYPRHMITNYQKEYDNKLRETALITKPEAFNIEKEHKILNPHKMELSTTNKTTF